VSSATATAAADGGQCAGGEYRPLVADADHLAIPGAAFADRLGADIMVGAETGGVPSLRGRIASR
jgi:hypothetical protein